MNDCLCFREQTELQFVEIRNRLLVRFVERNCGHTDGFVSNLRLLLFKYRGIQIFCLPKRFLAVHCQQVCSFALQWLKDLCVTTIPVGLLGPYSVTTLLSLYFFAY